MRPRLSLLLAATWLAGIACGKHDAASVRVSLDKSAGAAAVPLGNGDIRITSEDGGTDMALIDDTISAGLSQKALADVRRETDTSAVKGSGFGASIEKMVKGTVQTAIGARMQVPLSAVRDVRLDGRKIEFEWNGSQKSVFSGMNVNKKPLLESFSASDAQQFVDAVRARKNLPRAK